MTEPQDEAVREALVDQVARVLSKCDGFEDPLPPHAAEASRVYARVLIPLVQDARWLLAEAQHQLEMERLTHAITAQRLNGADDEVVLLRRVAEFEAFGVNYPDIECAIFADPVCACVPADEAAALAATGKFQPILCWVHPSRSGFCCDKPRPVRDPGEPDEHVIECGNCGANMDDDMLYRWRIRGGVA